MNHVYIRYLILAGAIIATGVFFWLIRDSLYPFIIAFIMAYLLNPAVCYLERKQLSRVWAIVVIYTFLISITVIISATLFPLLIRELEGLAHELPSLSSRGDELWQSVQFKYQSAPLPHSLRIALDNSWIRLGELIQQTITTIVDGLLSLVSHGVGLVISPILAFYYLYDWYNFKRNFYRLLPGNWRPRVRLFIKDIDKVLSGVIRGQIIIAIIVGCLVTIGLSILDIRFALLIGILAGFLDIIPYFGAFIGAAPAVAIALLGSPLLAGKVALLFFAIHQLESSIISPRILGDQVGLHPVTVIFFLLIGGEIGGLAGLLLGVPIAAIAKVVLEHTLELCIARPRKLSND